MKTVKLLLASLSLMVLTSCSNPNLFPEPVFKVNVSELCFTGVYNDGAETPVTEVLSGSLKLLSSYNWSVATGGYLSIKGNSSGGGGVHVMQIGIKEGSLAHLGNFPLELDKGYLIDKLVFTSSQGLKATVLVYYKLHNVVRIVAKDKSFVMGSPTGVGDADERPQHSVSFTKDFYMSKYQITNAQYVQFLNATGVGTDGIGQGETLIQEGHIWGVKYEGGQWQPQIGYENHPVVNVSWYGAKAYADWVGGCLPTEAQWEYACRAGSTAAYGMGNNNVQIADDNLENYAWYEENRTHAVGQKFDNAWGLYDMHGNVREWCSDWYEYDNTGVDTDPQGPNAGSSRILRGGGWDSSAQACRSAYRSTAAPTQTSSGIGFRVVFP